MYLSEKYINDYLNGFYTYSDKEHKEKLINKCIEICKRNKFSNFNNFIDYLRLEGFFDNLSHTEIFNIIKDGIPSKLFNKDICIGFNLTNDKLTIGLDPKKLYGKVFYCSILAEFPMSKRGYKYFENYFGLLLNNKTLEHKEWFKNSENCFYGKWQTFN